MSPDTNYSDRKLPGTGVRLFFFVFYSGNLERFRATNSHESGIDFSHGYLFIIYCRRGTFGVLLVFGEDRVERRTR